MAAFKHKMLMIEYKKNIGPFYEDMVALFDERDFSEKQVRQIVRLYDTYRGIIMIDKKTYEKAFRSIIGKQLLTKS